MTINNGGVYIIKNKAGGTFADLEDGNVKGYARKVNEDFVKQHWLIVRFNNNDTELFRVINIATNKLLEISDGSSTNGTQVKCSTLYKNESAKKEEWRIVAAPNNEGYFSLKNEQSGTYLDLDSGSNIDGSKIQGWSVTNSAFNDRQLWALDRRSRTTAEIATLTKADASLKISFTPSLFVQHLSIPDSVIMKIFDGVEKVGFPRMSDIYSFDHHPMNMKVAVGKWAAKHISTESGFHILCGVVNGRRHAKGFDGEALFDQAFNWWLSDDCNAVLCFWPVSSLSQPAVLKRPSDNFFQATSGYY